MKTLTLLTLLLSSCATTVPVTVDYTTVKDGQAIHAGYSTEKGATLAVHQK